MSTTTHCDCCILRRGFGPRRLRAFFLLIKHPEFDREDFHGYLHVETDHGGRARGIIAESPSKLDLIEPGEAA